MTTLREKVIEIDHMATQAKDDLVAENQERTDIAIYVHVFRDDRLVVSLQCPLDRDISLKAASMAAVGMSAEVMATTFESWHSQLPKSPVTHQDWEPGEMGFVAMTYPEAREKGWVDECLTTSAYDREGNYAMLSRPYLIKDRQVSYKDPVILESGEALDGGGAMHEAYVQIMSLPTIADSIAVDGDADAATKMIAALIADDETRYFHMDCATAKALAERDLITSIALLAEKDSMRQKLIDERFGDLGVQLED